MIVFIFLPSQILVGNVSYEPRTLLNSIIEYYVCNTYYVLTTLHGYVVPSQKWGNLIKSPDEIPSVKQSVYKNMSQIWVISCKNGQRCH